MRCMVNPHNATSWDSWWILIKQLHEIYGQSLQLNFMRSLVNFHNSTSWDRWWILIFLSQKNIRESLINFINFLWVKTFPGCVSRFSISFPIKDLLPSFSRVSGDPDLVGVPQNPERSFWGKRFPGENDHFCLLRVISCNVKRLWARLRVKSKSL